MLPLRNDGNAAVDASAQWPDRHTHEHGTCTPKLQEQSANASRWLDGARAAAFNTEPYNTLTSTIHCDGIWAQCMGWSLSRIACANNITHCTEVLRQLLCARCGNLQSRPVHIHKLQIRDNIGCPLKRTMQCMRPTIQYTHTDMDDSCWAHALI